MFADFSQEFPGKDRSYINLNNGTLGLTPESVLRNQCEEILAFEKNPTFSLGDAWRRLWEVQKDLGSFLKASPYDLFLRPNVTVALNDLLMGLPLPEGSEILTCAFEYGAIVNILKLKAQKEKLTLREMNFDFHLEAALTDGKIVDQIASQVSDKTSLVLLSHIFTGTGFCLPINKIGRKLRELGILLVVDGAHAPGLLPLDFSQDFSHVDFYAGNLHKWVMGPKGTAFGWAHPQKQDLLKNAYGSWTVFECPSHMQSFAEGQSFPCRMLWSHSQSFPAYFALQACFEFWNRYGSHFIQEEILKRQNYLKAELAKLGINPVVQSDNYQSALLCYELDLFSEKNFIAPLVMKADLSQSLQVGCPRVPQKNILRLTAHIHNDLDDLQKALRILEQSLK